MRDDQRSAVAVKKKTKRTRFQPVQFRDIATLRSS